MSPITSMIRLSSAIFGWSLDAGLLDAEPGIGHEGIGARAT